LRLAFLGVEVPDTVNAATTVRVTEGESGGFGIDRNGRRNHLPQNKCFESNVSQGLFFVVDSDFPHLLFVDGRLALVGAQLMSAANFSFRNQSPQTVVLR